MRIGRHEDQCEVVMGAHVAHPHGAGRHPHRHAGDRAHDRRRLLIALGITGIVFVAELLGGLLSRSLALMGDAGHMLTDLSAQLLALLALLIAARPADTRRTYGYYRLEILAALANGIVLVGLAGFTLYYAAQRLSAPVVVRTELMLPVAALGLFANATAVVLLHGALSLNVRGAYWHLISDSLSSFAVVLGALVMHYQKGLHVIDPLLSMVIGALVLMGAYRLIREATDVLLEAVPAGIDVEQVRHDVEQLEGIKDVHDLHIWTITSGMVALSAHIVVAKEFEISANDALLTRIKHLLHRNHRIVHSTLQIESTEYQHVAHVH